MNKKKAIAIAGVVLAAVATALLSTPYGSNPTVHAACETALKVLALLGLTAPISVMAPGSLSGSAPNEKKEEEEAKGGVNA